jgi:group I intron endonuclease
VEIKLDGCLFNKGIYKITNKQNNRIYIGSTSCFKKRFNTHRNDLKMNRHGNNFLQNDFNKYGTDVFLIEIIEVVETTKEDRLQREQFYLDQFFDSQKQCYNLRKDVFNTRESQKNINPIDRKNDLRCLPHDELHKQKISSANKKSWKDVKLREQASENSNRRWKDNEYQKYQLTNKSTGETVLINCSLRRWCLSRGLSYKAMHLLVKGKVKSSQGWFFGTDKPVYINRKGEKRKLLTLEQRTAKSNGKFEGRKLINGKGEILLVEKNIREQCRTLNLHYRTFLKVLNENCGSIGGWRNQVNT